jgi:hypothetical protein
MKFTKTMLKDSSEYSKNYSKKLIIWLPNWNVGNLSNLGTWQERILKVGSC